MPHVAHVVVIGLHASPDAVQKLASPPVPFGLPLQHASPLRPHVPAEPPVQWLLLQVPSAAVPQLLAPPDATHVPPTQQRVPLHCEFWQHGWPVPPQGVASVPLSQMLPALDVSPVPMQLPPLQQSPPLHVVEAQHCSVTSPHALHVPPAVQIRLPLQLLLVAMH